MSAPDTRPETDGSSAGAEEARRESLRLWLFVVGMLAFGVVCWLAYPHAVRVIKRWLGRRHLSEVEHLIDARQWQQAAATLSHARRWAPDDPEVMRATVAFMTHAGAEPRLALAVLEQLQGSGHATVGELAHIGRLRLATGDATRARQIFQQLPPEARHTREALELQAGLLEADGQPDRAAGLRRDALVLQAGEDPAALLKLARLDLNGTDPSRRDAMRERLWQMARGSDRLQLEAVGLLADDADLTLPQAEELDRLVASAAGDESQRDRVRLAVLSARLRVSPHQRSELIDAEIPHWAQRPPTQIAPFAVWLAQQREFQRLLRMMTPEIAGRFTDLLPPYVDALRGLNRWEELETLLTAGRIDPAFPARRLRLWLAEVQSHRDGDSARARQTLENVFEDAGRGEAVRDTLETAELAERLKLWDVAQRCYQALADKQPALRLTALIKVYAMADVRLDGPGMLRSVTELERLKPENPPFQLQHLYLQLLLGTDLELASRQLQNLTVPDTAQDQWHLIQALAAYRQGRPEVIRAILPKIREPDRLPPGQRTLYAAFLKSTGGEAGRVFRIIERISPVVLLPEEKAFYQRAL